jgi:hypothetical protein|tara:strand:- start:454 stop:684 length:231 start_codon:yes stop_codon:yes gene_type:complete
MNIEDKILTKKRFCDMVESYVFEKRESYMDAIVDIMKANQIEAERVSVLINTSIKDKLEAEARNLNYLERINTLPL